MPSLISLTAAAHPQWYEARFPFDRSVIDTIKQLPGARWEPIKKIWLVPENALPSFDSLGLKTRVLGAGRKFQAPPVDHNFTMGMRPYQIEGVQRLLENPGYMLTFEPRVGKGLVAGSLVQTPQGLTRIEDLRVGDHIFDEKGDWAHVVGVFERGVLPLYRVTFSDKTSVVTDAEHLWAVQTNNQRKRGQPGSVISTLEIFERGTGRAGSRGFEFSIPVCEPLNFSETSLPYAYGVGAMLGDGSFGRKSLTFCKPNAQVAAAVSESLGFGLITSINSKTRSTSWKVPSSLRPLFDRLGLLGTDSYTKFIPDEFFSADLESRKALMAGLLDTDGHVQKDGSVIEFSTSSARLADGVVRLARELGCVVTMSQRVPTYSYKGKKLRGALNYRVWIRTAFNPFRAETGNLNRWRASTLCKTITKVVPAGTGRSICIKTSARSELFVAGAECIVTHNTRTALGAMASAFVANKIDTALILVPGLGVRAEWERQSLQWTGLPLQVVEGLQELGPRLQAWSREMFPYPLAITMGIELLRGTVEGRAPDTVFHPDEPLASLFKLLTNRGRFAIICDEIHRLRNRKAPRAYGLLELARMPGAVYRWGLTGTPMRNRPRDMWIGFEFVQPGCMGSYSKFTKRFAEAHQGMYGWVDKGSSNEEELAARLSVISFRKTREEVAAWLPVADRKIVLCSMGKEEEREYQAQERALGPDIAAALNDSQSARAIAAMKTLAALTSKSKMATLCERVREHVIERRVKAVVFAYHHDTLSSAWDAIEADFVPETKDKIAPPIFVAGGWMLPEKRRKEIERWKACPGPAVLLANSESSGVGIDLADADTAIFLELSWVPADFLQVEARVLDVHQGKRKTPPMYEYILVRKTLDEDMAVKLIDKIGNASKVVGSDQHSGAVSDMLRGSGLVDRSVLSLANEDPETVDAAIKSMLARLGESDISDTGDNNDAQDEEVDEEEIADE